MGGQGRKTIIPHVSPKRYRERCGLPKPLPLGATATTAASGGNREELLGPRPAGCERQRSRRWELQPGLGEELATRLRGCTKTSLPSVARPALLRHITPQASSRKLTGLPRAPPLGATATTAASGGNRESLLGPRPAGCERQRSRRWESQPGQWRESA